MCVIIDANTYAPVFNRSCQNHKEFEPVLNWILKGKGFIIYGGSKYIKELLKTERYIKLINLLKDIHKAKRLNDKLVDDEEKRIAEIIPEAAFNDKQLAAMVCVSNCKIICSEDSRSIEYVTMSKIYPKNVDIPKYYTSSKNKNILCDKNIHKKYKPFLKLNKKSIERVDDVLNKISSK